MCGLHAWVPCSLAVCGSADLKRQQEIGNGVGCPFNSAFPSRPWEATAPVSPFLQPGSLPPGSGNLSSPRPFRLKDGRGSLLLLAPECFAALAGFRLPVHHLLIKLSLLSPLSVLSISCWDPDRYSPSSSKPQPCLPYSVESSFAGSHQGSGQTPSLDPITLYGLCCCPARLLSLVGICLCSSGLGTLQSLWCFVGAESMFVA